MRDSDEIINDYNKLFGGNFFEYFADVADVFSSNVMPIKFDTGFAGDLDKDGVLNEKDCQPLNSLFQDLTATQSDIPSNPDEDKSLLQKIKDKVKKFNESQAKKDAIINKSYEAEKIRQLQIIGRELAKKNLKSKPYPGQGTKIPKGGLFAGLDEEFFGPKKPVKKKVTIEANDLMNLNIEDL